MRSFLFSAIASAAVVAPGGAVAGNDIEDRTQALRLCRATVAQQAGVDDDDVRLDQVRVRGKSVLVDIDLWRDGKLQNIRCDVSRGAELLITSITPAVQPTFAAQ
jgi:hypothetical protein